MKWVTRPIVTIRHAVIGPVLTVAQTYGGFAVHRAGEDSPFWTVTDIASGWALGHFSKRRTARAIAEHMAPHNPDADPRDLTARAMALGPIWRAAKEATADN